MQKKSKQNNESKTMNIDDAYRADTGLAWILQYENIAWYEEGKVAILDRRIYPIRTEFVICRSYKEVARAIADMVTQSAGPYVAAAMGMALSAYECRKLKAVEQKAYLEEAAEALSTARPTTSKRMKQVTNSCLKIAFDCIEEEIDDVAEMIKRHAINLNNERYDRIGRAANYLVEKFPSNGKVMTQCFAETMVGQMLKYAKLKGKEVSLYCPETRPYFQGSRLTASVGYDMGFDVNVITDNMPAAVMKNERIDLFTSAADVICRDGHVVNKVGTYQIAITADYHGIPYYVTGTPDTGHRDVSTVTIEMRNPALVLSAMGTPCANPNVNAYYPAFDITPPELVKGVVTDKGIFSPYELDKYVSDGESFLV